MATTGSPFDKPMDELREAFVRARFAQEDVFGLPSIEAWLAKQREAERPAELVWRRFIDAERVRRPFHIRELPDLAIPQDLPRGFSIRQIADVGDPLVAMLCESVDRKRVDVLPADERLTLFLLKGEDGAPAHAFALTPQSKKRRSGDPLAYTLYVPSDKDLLQVVLSRGWSVGPKKVVTAARQLLCDTLAAEILLERAKAEADFDSAVAVSADGMKIMSAKIVVVIDDNRERVLGVYQAAAFRDRKILLAPEEDRLRFSDRPDYGDNRSIFDLVAQKNWSTLALWVLRNSYYRFFGDDRPRRDSRDPLKQALIAPHAPLVFCTTQSFCPSPLPDGGVEVTV